MLKNVRKSKVIIILLSSILLGSAIAETYMWMMHQTEVNNHLQSRTVEVEIDEEFPYKEINTKKPVMKKVSFHNTGTASVFLRFTYAQYWETENQLLEGYEDSAVLNWKTDLLRDWYEGNDGWYYYNKVVPSNDSVNILESVYFEKMKPDNANYNLFFQVETAQVSDENSVNEDVTVQLFGRKGLVNKETIVNGAITSGIVTWGNINEEI